MNGLQVCQLAARFRHLCKQKLFFILLSAIVILLLLSCFLKYDSIFVHKSTVRHPFHKFEDAYQQDSTKFRIMVTWYGRMGNHMFQYSCLIGVAQKNNMLPIIPNNLDLLDIFYLPTLVGSKSLLRHPVVYRDELPAKYDRRTENLNVHHDVFLDGYHQSWKYHWHIRDKLIDQHFVFHDVIANKALKFIESVRQKHNMPNVVVVGVHVRRGDFVRQRIKGYTAATIPFYYKAMNYFRRRYSNIAFVICTNDIYWVMDNLDQAEDIHYSVNDAAVDLAILAESDHVIITSGSFSWWAGYLNKGEVVYFKGYPEPMSKIGNLTIREDYYPPTWIAM